MNKLNKSRFIDDKPEMVDNIKEDSFIDKMLELTDVISTVKFLTTRKGYGILKEKLLPIIDTMAELKENGIPFHMMRTTEHRGLVKDSMNDPDSVLPPMWAETSILVDKPEFYAAEGASEKQVICDLVCKLFELAENDSTDLFKGSNLVRIDYSDSENSAYLQYAGETGKTVHFEGTNKKDMLVNLVNAIAETDD